ncbi:MAG: hypothetical protein ACRD3C_24960 [Vicinamibacterales bacterium]
MNRPQAVYFPSGPLVYFPSGARRAVRANEMFGDPMPVEVSPGPPPRDFLTDVRDAARYGGAEFLDLIVQASEEITTRQSDLPDPIDPSSI